MKTILSFVTVFFITLTIKAQVFKFESEIINYGKILQGAEGKRVFNFTNIGDAPLIIKRVQATCGCTVPKTTQDPIMPGAKGTIEVSYDTKRLGGFSKALTVYSNAKTERKMLKIKGNISKDAVAEKPASIVTE